ncbi:DNA-directed RNA polymerase subunit beta [Atopostipes suicloacalis DSM 15692]|uniref:DNA-directed RNA polymerase subunit beta n=1 Tax=Atopostipes suicloacalis DSM 15692 TaxID=1121025 RepID=A0A1M4U6L8_9LACT|nr:DNA-directed RNA polymerase subunit beta [Atopostipes suicloacalis]SHE52481.1 DNA-directed RNA polymerase subunit beta [Atopostipes suicloacalis DSM 15692]
MNWTNVLKSTLFYLLRFLLIVLLIIVAFAVGAMLGYSVIGDGANPMDIFNRELWEHILNFVF